MGKHRTAIEKLLSINEVARILGLKKLHVLGLIEIGEIPPPFKIGPHERWRLKDLESFISFKANLSYRLKFNPSEHTVKVERAFQPGDFPEELREVHNSLLEYTLFNKLPCVYFLINFGVIVYVGKSLGMPVRVGQHQRGNKTEVKKEFNRVLYLPVEEDRLASAEKHFIKMLKPLYNDIGVDVET